MDGNIKLANGTELHLSVQLSDIAVARPPELPANLVKSDGSQVEYVTDIVCELVYHGDPSWRYKIDSYTAELHSDA